MKKTILLLMFLTSIFAIGQTENFYEEDGNQIYKIEIDYNSFSLLDKEETIIYLNSEKNDTQIVATYNYENGILSLSDIEMIKTDEPIFIFNENQLSPRLKKSVNGLIKNMIKNKVLLEKLKSIIIANYKNNHK